MAGVVLGLGLAGCVQDLSDAKLASPDARATMAIGPSAAVALASIDGPPAPMIAHLKEAVTAEAAGRELTFTDPAIARYVVRGYLDAYSTDSGTSIRYVWDVYDASRRRVQRLDDGLDIPGSASDPWSALDDKVLAGIASRSAGTLAAYLAATPDGSGPVPAAAAAPAAIAQPK